MKKAKNEQPNVNPALRVGAVRLPLPNADEITEASMEYAEIDETTELDSESIRGAAHFVAGAAWYHRRITGNGA